MRGAMRNISFMLTVDQFKARTKTVTRRRGWRNLRAGDRLMGCRKCQGLKKGEAIEKLGVIEVISVDLEQLLRLEESDTAKEGFPELTAAEFVAMFCRHMKATPSWYVTRIEFKYIDQEPE